MNDFISALTLAGIDAFTPDQSLLVDFDASVIINSNLSSLVSGRVYPLKLPDNPELPSVVYQPVGVDWIELDGQKLGRIDQFVLSIRTSTFEELNALSKQVSSSIQAFSSQTEIIDAAADYEDKQKQFRAHFEIQITTMATPTKQLPVVFAYPLRSEAGDNQTDNRVTQRVTEGLSFVLVCNQSDLGGLRDLLEDTLLGLTINPYVDSVQYEAGSLVEQSGPVTYWRELYSYARYIRS